MKLKLLSPLRNRGFAIRSELPVHDPQGYAGFWDAVERKYGEDPGSIPSSQFIAELRFAHASRYAGRSDNRYRSLESDSLIRPLHVLEIVPDTTKIDMVGLFEAASEAGVETVTQELGSRASDSRSSGAGASASASSVLSAVADAIRENPPQVLIRVYNHSISMIEVDLPLDDHLFDPEVNAELALDQLRQTGVEFVERLVRTCQNDFLRALFQWLRTGVPQAQRYVRRGLTSDDGDAAGSSVGRSNKSDVLWVTRTLLFEHETSPPETSPKRQEVLIRHWLADVFDSEKSAVIQKKVDEPTAYSLQWVNYLFREQSYEGAYPQDGWGLEDGLAKPFCRPWEAMINSQYYYAAFDVLQTTIHSALARSYAKSEAGRVRQFKDQLDEIVKESNLVMLDYHGNFNYYHRTVSAHMRKILGMWNFESVLLEQITMGVQACNERVTELHNRATERSSVYTDLILLSIGVTSVFGILLSLLTYGREMARELSGNFSTASYEQGSFNFAAWLATHSTDGILLVAFILSAGLVALYFHFKRQQLL